MSTNQDDAHICKPPKPLDKSILVDMPCVHAQSFSHVQLFVTPWTVAHQSPLSMGFPRQEYWSGLPFTPSGGCADPCQFLLSFPLTPMGSMLGV